MRFLAELVLGTEKILSGAGSKTNRSLSLESRKKQIRRSLGQLIAREVTPASKDLDFSELAC
jgi:hypothetical protein